MCNIFMLFIVPSTQSSINWCWHHSNFKSPNRGESILGTIASKIILYDSASWECHVNVLNVQSRLVTVTVCIFQRQLLDRSDV